MPMKTSDTTKWIWYIATEAIKERRIALPTKRLAWYCNWLYLPVTKQQVQTAMYKGVRQGKFVAIRVGTQTYYKIKR